MKRVLVVTSNFGGGTGKHLVGMLSHLDRERWQVEVLCQGRKELDAPEHVPVLEFRGSGWTDRFPLAQIRRVRQLRHRLEPGRPDLIHAYFFWPVLYARFLKRKGLIRHLVENREDQGFNLSAWNYRVLRATSDIPDRVICVSEAVRQVVLEREGVDESRVVVVHNGVELSEPMSAAANQRDTREELGFSRAHRIVGMVSNLNRAVKGVGYFVEAMPLILDRIPEARFLILGGGPDERPLRKRARELGIDDRVVFAGFQPDIERFYAIMDVSVLTSLSEGLSMTLLESMSFELPIVATRVGGNPELVRDGETGFLIPARDSAAFAERVIELLLDPHARRRMGRAGRRLVEREFSLSMTARRYEAVYSDVLGADG